MLERIKNIVCEFANIKPEDLSESTDLHTDLGLKSLDLVNLAVALEDEFETEIPDRDIARIVTIGDILTYLDGVA